MSDGKLRLWQLALERGGKSKEEGRGGKSKEEGSQREVKRAINVGGKIEALATCLGKRRRRLGIAK